MRSLVTGRTSMPVRNVSPVHAANENGVPVRAERQAVHFAGSPEHSRPVTHDQANFLRVGATGAPQCLDGLRPHDRGPRCPISRRQCERCPAA